MNSFTSPRFWRHYNSLLPEIRKLADGNFQLFKANPQHPSLHFERKKPDLWSVRVGRGIAPWPDNSTATWSGSGSGRTTNTSDFCVFFDEPTVRIETVQPLAGFRLQVRFNDGLEGVYPVEPARRGGVFLKLINPEIFTAVRINDDFGCVEWPGGVDLCPDTMHRVISGVAVEVESSEPMALHEDPQRSQ